MSKRTSEKQCVICGSQFDTSVDKHMNHSSKYYCIDCYIEWATTKKKPLSKDIALENVSNYQKEREEKMSFQLSKDRFNDYILNAYDLIKLNGYVWTKLSDITTGKGLREPISYDDLLFIFQRQQAYLNGVYQRNMSIGKKMTSQQRINYDLAIVVSLYDNYKEWKRKQEILAIETKQQIELETKQIASIKNVSKQTNKDEDDIYDIIEELYG